MRFNLRNILLVGAFAFATVGLVAPQASAQETGTGAFKCQLDLWKSFKLANFAEKFIGKCVIDYEKRNLFLGGEKGKLLPDTLFKSGELCENFVANKALATVDAGIATGNCGDDDLLALGHMPSTIGNAGALLAMEALNAGLRRAGAGNNDLWAIMGTVGGLSQTPCSTCELLLASDSTLPGAFTTAFESHAGPCVNMVCGLSVGSSISLQGIPVPVSGSLNIDVCDYNPLGGGDLGVFNGSARTVKAAIPGTADVCVSGGGTRGVISNGGSILGATVALNTCQDHIVGNGTCSTTSQICATDGDCPATETCVGNTESNECITTGGPDSDPTPFTATQCQPNLAPEGGCSATPGTRCNSAADCPLTETCSIDTIPSGICARLTPGGAPSAGDALISTVLINTVTGPGDLGADGVPCTLDDTATPTAPLPGAQTTGTADSVIYDALLLNVPSDGNTTQMVDVVGTPFTVATALGVPGIEGGELDGALASAFPALSLELLPGVSSIDGNVSILLNCTTP